jgi:hypothetical protein
MSMSCKAVGIVLAVAASFAAAVHAEKPDTLWTRTYRYGYGVSVAAIARAEDDGFLLLGTTAVPPIGDSYLYLMRFTGDGDTLWTKLLVDGASARSLARASDGGYLILANLGYDIHLIKIDPAGEVVWTRTYGWSYPGWGDYDDDAFSIHEMQDGTYWVVGITGSEIPWEYETDVILMRMDAAGDTLWTRRYDWTGMTLAGQKPCFGLPTADGNFMLIGYTDTHAATGTDVLVAKVDQDGDSLWMRTYDASGRERAYAAVPAEDGGSIILGDSDASGDWRDWVLRIGPEGDTLWTRNYSGEAYGGWRAMSPTSDGGYLVAGCVSFTGPSGDSDVHLIKAGDDGDTLWTASFGTEVCDCGNAALEVRPGLHIIAGATGPCGDPSTPRQAYIVKVAEPGTDISPPGLVLAVLQNPYLSQYLDVYLIGSESLDSASVTIEAGGMSLPVRAGGDGGRVWLADFKLGQGTGAVSLSATASDTAGNRSSASRTFSYAFVSASAGGTVRGPAGRVSLRIPRGSMANDAWVTITPSAGSLETGAPPIYDIGPPGVLEGAAYLEIDYSVEFGEIHDPLDLAIVQEGSGPLESFVDPGRRTIGARVKALGRFSVRTGCGCRSVEADPRFLAVEAGSPNPFSESVRATFEIRAPLRIRADVFDILGRHTASLFDGPAAPGGHIIVWDGKDGSGRQAPGGVYFLRISSGGESGAIKVILAR